MGRVVLTKVYTLPARSVLVLYSAPSVALGVVAIGLGASVTVGWGADSSSITSARLASRVGVVGAVEASSSVSWSRETHGTRE
jgi:hypothetical protein